MMNHAKNWYASGSPFIWLNAGAVAIAIVMTVGLLVLIAARGLGHFWPANVETFDYHEGEQVLQLAGELVDEEWVPAAQLREAGLVIAESDTNEAGEVRRYLLKTGNRDVVGLDFRWVLEPAMKNRETPQDMLVLERREWGNFYGYLVEVREHGQTVATGEAARDELFARLARVSELYEQISEIQSGDIGSVNYQLERLRLDERSLELAGDNSPAKLADIAAERAELERSYGGMQQSLEALFVEARRDSILMRVSDGREVEIPMAHLVDAWYPNEMGVGEKSLFYVGKFWDFLSDEPREANTEGGIFPAIFGTVMMVILMSVIVTPFGVVAAVYLREYASQGPITRLVRIAVNNLAGVPSIVYGVFGLGFFVYFLGGNIDDLFFEAAKPAPTFGTPGLLWASLTLALLTVPVVIVATEEGLSRIPKSIREGSLALGATKAETLWRTVLPMASPAIMTGLILAIARAAGEVAPLMLVGVVKLAPTLPLDGDFPFLHMERKFMHLGFHIYDVGFQSPNVEAARPLVYATALLLVLVIILLNLAAIAIRNRLREKYKALEN